MSELIKFPALNKKQSSIRREKSVKGDVTSINIEDPSRIVLGITNSKRIEMTGIGAPAFCLAGQL